MKPDRSNYEILIIDWLDGNLSDQQAAELKAFLDGNPDLRNEIDGLAFVKLKPRENLFAHREILNKSTGSLSREQFEHLCIAYLENDLGPEQRSELLEMVSNDDNKKREFELTMKIKLKPPQYNYAGKKRIKKLTTGEKIIRMAAAGLSAAAAIAALITVFLSFPSDRTKDEIRALNLIKPDTLLIHRSLPITVTEKQDQPLIKSILPSEVKLTVTDLQLPEQNILLAGEPEQFISDSENQIRRITVLNSVSVPSTGSISLIRVPVPDANMLLAYNKAATLPSPFEEDRSNVDRFFARIFHEKILKDKAGSSPVKSFDLALAGITGLNKLFGWQIALHKNLDANGEVKSYNFSSKLLKFNTPVKKNTDSL